MIQRPRTSDLKTLPMVSAWSSAGAALAIEVSGDSASASNGHPGGSNGHPDITGALFATAFDVGEVVWVDDLPVFEAVSPPVARTSLRQSSEAPPLRVRRPTATLRPLLVPPPLHQRPQAPPTLLKPQPPTGPPRLSSPQPPGQPALALGPAHLAWLVSIPIGLAAVTAAWLAPGMVNSMLPGATWRAFPSLTRSGLIRPEQTDQVRYLVSLATPALLVGLVYVSWRQVAGLRRRSWMDVVVIAVQVIGLALSALCWYVQRSYLRWFSDWNLLVALGLACLLLAGARSTTRLSSRRRPGRVVRWLALAAAVVLTGLWLLPSIFNDSNIADAHPSMPYHLQFTYDEFLSVLNGRTPVVDFIPLYSRLLPFAAEPVFRVFGSTVETFTWMMWVLSLVSFVTIYLMLRVVTRGSLTALLLYVPFLAVALLPLLSYDDQRYFLANLYGLVPLRAVGPFLLAWLCALHIQRPRRGGVFGLFFLGGLITFNNPDFGLASFLAVLVALWCGSDRGASGFRRALSLVWQALAGGLVSLAAASSLTLARASSLPRWDYLNHFQRVFAVEGFGQIPMPLFGLHVIVYLTFIAALVGAVITTTTGRIRENRVLIGMLAYSGVLGLVSFSYWVGRSHPNGLFAMFPQWGLAISLLAWWMLTAAARRTPAETASVRPWVMPSLAVLTMFGLMVTAITHFPSPGAQLRRVRAPARAPVTGKPLYLYDAKSSFDPSAVTFVAQHATPGEPVAILASVSHGIAERAGVVNVAPFAHQDSIGFDEQMALVLEALEDSGGSKVFLGPSYQEIPSYLQTHGYVVTATEGSSGLLLFSRDGVP